MTKIVISYRRSDSDVFAGRVRDRIANQFGEESVFIDIDNIPFGRDFRFDIQEALANADAVLAIVGSRWLGLAKGRSRVMDPTDPVRIELETALSKGIPIIPILVGSASMPKPEQLPESLKDFAFINAAPVDTGRDFHRDLNRVIATIDTFFQAPPNMPGEGADYRPRVSEGPQPGTEKHGAEDVEKNLEEAIKREVLKTKQQRAVQKRWGTDFRTLNIFKPKGNRAADVAAQADPTLRKQNFRDVVWIGLGGVVTGLLSYPSQSLGHQLEWLGPGVLFGALLAFTNWKFGLRGKLRLGLIVVFTVMAWVSAYTVTMEIYGQLTIAEILSIGGPTTDPAAVNSNKDATKANAGASAGSARIPMPRTGIGATSGVIGGLTGGAVTLAGIAIVNPRLRRIRKLLPILACAAAVGSLLELIAAIGPIIGNVILFASWQAAVAAMIADALLTSSSASRTTRGAAAVEVAVTGNG